MFTKQFKLTLVSIFGLVFVVGILTNLFILTQRVNNHDKQFNTVRVDTVVPTPFATATPTATPASSLRFTPTKSIVAPTKVIVPVSATPTL